MRKIGFEHWFALLMFVVIVGGAVHSLKAVAPATWQDLLNALAVGEAARQPVVTAKEAAIAAKVAAEQQAQAPGTWEAWFGQQQYQTGLTLLNEGNTIMQTADNQMAQAAVHDSPIGPYDAGVNYAEVATLAYPIAKERFDDAKIAFDAAKANFAKSLTSTTPPPFGP